MRNRVDVPLRDRVTNGRHAWMFDRGRDFACGICVIDPLFMRHLVRERLEA